MHTVSELTLHNIHFPLNVYYVLHILKCATHSTMTWSFYNPALSASRLLAFGIYQDNIIDLEIYSQL